MIRLRISIHDLTRRSTRCGAIMPNDVCISIHDLTRRSTIPYLIRLPKYSISIHDLTRRSTIRGIMTGNEVRFQFTTSQGGRRIRCTSYIRWTGISIHDLTRRSTWISQSIVIPVDDFNSRPHKEVDQSDDRRWTEKSISIHDLTRRSTAERLMSGLERRHFNSRPHKEVDLAFHQYHPSPYHFNSRPHKEVDRADVAQTIADTSFQFTTSQGGRRFPRIRTDRWYYFNSRPHKEVDTVSSSNELHTGTFQFTTSQGGRLNNNNVLETSFAFQFTTSQGGRRWSRRNNLKWNRYFNSRPHKEVDCVVRAHVDRVRISIHDLTRRSTPIL